jgi:hypothetical protein
MGGVIQRHKGIQSRACLQKRQHRSQSLDNGITREQDGKRDPVRTPGNRTPVFPIKLFENVLSLAKRIFCFIGQGAFIHESRGHAAPDTPGD